MHSATLSPPANDSAPTPKVARRAARPVGSLPRTPRQTSAANLGAAQAQEVGVEADAAPRRRAARAEHPGRGDVLLYVLMTALIAAAWQVTQLKLFVSSDDASYWIAVTGGSMMLLLFSYPLRKYLPFMQRLGKVKWWFWLHLFLGVAGPWLILVHSTFHIGSLNAGVALFSMAIVVGSGVVGRVIYVRVHRGLNGQLMSLSELRAKAGLVESEARSHLHFAPQVEAALLAFEQKELNAKPGWLTRLRQVSLLPMQRYVAYLRCVAELNRCLRTMARERHWPDADLQRRERRLRRLVDRYLDAVVRVAQYTAYERVFALWHMAHLPFVYLLVISAIVHVIAVHAY